MRPDIIKLLQADAPNKEISDLMQRCKSLLKLSRTEMVRYYPNWDRYDRTYRGEMLPDDNDKKAKDRKEPMKMVVPLTYQQVQTFVSFVQSLFNQRDSMYEIQGTGAEDEDSAKIADACIERDLDYNRFKSEKMTQFLTDVGRYGVGVLKHSWVRKTVPVVQQVPDPSFQPDPSMSQIQPPLINQVVDAVKYLGNDIKVVNPYRFFPDPRIPITRFQEGEFCADEIEYGRGELMDMQQQGICAGVDLVPAFRQEDLDGRRLIWIGRDPTLMNEKEPNFILISEVQITLNPAQTKIDGTKVLDSTIDRPVKYLVWIANDSRIIRLEDMGYEHDEFTYDVGQYHNDQIRFINFGLAEMLGPLQDTISWFINARVSSVRKVIQNYLVVDPSGIELQDLKDRSPILRLKKSLQGTGVEKYIHQLKVDDVTTGHLNDVNFLTQYARESSGITDNLLGQFAPGRRSAQEARNVATNAAQRLILIAHGLWETALLPMGRKLLSNLRQGLDEPATVRIVGQSRQGTPGMVNFLSITKADLIGNYDFMVFDGTLPSQRGAIAQRLTELLGAMAKDPRLVFLFGLDPKLVLYEALDLSDIRNVQRFELTPQRAQELAVMAGLARNQGGTPNAGGGGVPNAGPGPQPPARNPGAGPHP